MVLKSVEVLANKQPCASFAEALALPGVNPIDDTYWYNGKQYDTVVKRQSSYFLTWLTDKDLGWQGQRPQQIHDRQLQLRVKYAYFDVPFFGQAFETTEDVELELYVLPAP